MQPRVTVTFASQSRYWFVTIQCVDRSKLLFDTVCTLADMDYDVYHAAIDSSTGSDSTLLANQEFYIRPRLGMAEWDAVKAEKLRCMLRAAITRRFPKGLKIFLQCVGVRRRTQIVLSARNVLWGSKYLNSTKCRRVVYSQHL